MSPRIAPVLLAAALLAVPSAARADVLETPAPGAANLAAGGGWQAWSSPSDDGTFRLVVRKPDGTVLTPAIPAFRAPVDPAIGTRGGADGVNTPASRRLSAVYSRCAGTSTVVGCDVHALDLTTLREAKVPALATTRYSETAPSVTLGRWAVARRGQGTYAYSEASGRVRRLTSLVALETAASPSRVVLTSFRSGSGYDVRVLTASGGRSPLVLGTRLREQPRSPQLTRYRAGWLVASPDATHLLVTNRFAGSGGPYTASVQEAPRTLPAGVRSAAGDASTLFDRYVDAAGVQRIVPGIR